MKYLLFILCLLLPFKSFAWQIERHDCESVGAYLESNSQAIAVFTTNLVPLIGTTDAILPWSDPQANIDYVGLGLGIAKGFVQVGVSPLGTVNTVLGLFCINITNPSVP